jgi:uncharacterized membrane protein YhaH (DUF805 family)
MQKYLSFNGRAGRQELWIMLVAVSIVGGLGEAACVQMHSYAVAALVMLAVVWLSTALAARRWHDLGRSGWSILLQVIPIVNLWCFYMLAFRSGERGVNRFGADPIQA